MLAFSLFGCIENQFLFFPSHENSEFLAKNSDFVKWTNGEKYIGWKRVSSIGNRSWLFIHGNAGQAIHRRYAENCFSPAENIFILEYPGYGERSGTPSADAFNKAALEAYNLLKEEIPEDRICVIGESIGSGPSCFLASQDIRPEKIVLAVPFDNLQALAQEKMPFIPVAWIMQNQWDNVDLIKSFGKPVEVYGAMHDIIIPFHRAKRLADSNKHCRFHKLSCGHNDWPDHVKLYE